MLLYMDGFDHYTTTATGSAHSLVTIQPDLWLGAVSEKATHVKTMPVLGGRGLLCNWREAYNASDTRMKLPKTFGNGETIGIGFHFYMNNLPASTSYGHILSLGNGVLSTAPFLSVRVNSAGTLSLMAGAWNGTVLGTSTETLGATTLHHLEFKFVLGASGTFEVRLNGEVFWTYSGSLSVTTFGYLVFGYHQIGFAGDYWDSEIYYDNLYIWDDQGTDHFDFLGERNVYTLLTEADDTPQDWVPSVGDAWEALNNIPVNADYLESDSAGNTSMFVIANTPVSNLAPSAVQVNLRAQKTASGGASIKAVIDVGGVEAEGPTQSLVQSQYIVYPTIFTTQPNGSPWSLADVQNMKAGIRSA